MSMTYRLFSLWKEHRRIPSDNAGAIALGVTRGAVSLWKQGRNAEADVIERMARDLGEDPARWAALVMAEQTKGEASRAWTRIARQLGAAAAVAAVALFSVNAQGVEPAHLGTYAYYVKLTLAMSVTGALAAALSFAYGRALRRLP